MNARIRTAAWFFCATSALAFWPMLTAIVILIAEWGTRPAPEHAANGVILLR